MTRDEQGAPTGLGNTGRVAAPIWIAAVVLTYLGVREIGLRLLP